MTLKVPTIAIVNESSVVSSGEVAALALALQHQVAYDFKPVWGRGAHVVQDTIVPRAAWGLVILDTSDQAGALGYHDVTAAGLPLGKVFAKSDLDYGYNWTITASHELLEMLGDPWIDTAVQVGASTFYALEVADACESDEYGYEGAGNVMVSDFVYPRWFDGKGSGPYDHAGHITRARQLLPGGYIGAWTPSAGWSQITADESAHPSRRIALRQRGAANMIESVR